MALPRPGYGADVRDLPDRDALRQVASELLPAHPWPAVAFASAIKVGRGWTDYGVLAWLGGNPWRAEHCGLHMLTVDEPDPATLTAAEALLRRHGEPGEPVITSPAVAAAAGLNLTSAGAYGWWDLRAVRHPLAHQPYRTAGWLAPDANREIDALLDIAMPHAAFRPGSSAVGRWCGVRDTAGALVACAAETLPAAPIAHLSALAVRPDARRAGLGADVTAFFVAQTLAEGAPQVVLAVDDWNIGAKLLYDQLGFATWPLAGATIPLR